MVDVGLIENVYIHDQQINFQLALFLKKEEEKEEKNL